MERLVVVFKAVMRDERTMEFDLDPKTTTVSRFAELISYASTNVLDDLILDLDINGKCHMIYQGHRVAGCSYKRRMGIERNDDYSFATNSPDFDGNCSYNVLISRSLSELGISSKEGKIYIKERWIGGIVPRSYGPWYQVGG